MGLIEHALSCGFFNTLRKYYFGDLRRAGGLDVVEAQYGTPQVNAIRFPRRLRNQLAAAIPDLPAQVSDSINELQ
jgi:hypothetical protein